MNPHILALWDRISQGITITDAQNQCVYMNAYQKEIDGFKDEDCLGKTIYELYTNIEQDYYTTQRCLETGRAIQNEIGFYRTSTGVVTNGLYSLYPFFEDTGEVAGLIRFLTDVQTSVLLFNALDKKKLPNLRSELHPQRSPYTFETMVGNDFQFRRSIEQAYAAAQNDSPVLIWGESGTGKELFAQSIHNQSRRYKKPLIPINCAAIPEHLLESILFGTSKGAFTDAREKKGLLESANGGTVLLDEINSMPIRLQAKLLRVIEEKKVRRIGSVDEIAIDLKIVTTSNIDPRKAIQKKLIREDLLYRLAVIVIKVPPLRERKNDIPLLCDHFLRKYQPKTKTYLAKEVYELFLNYSWPGNVRELENTIQSALVFSRNKKLITTLHLSQYFVESCRKDTTQRQGEHVTPNIDSDPEKVEQAPVDFPSTMKLNDILLQTEKKVVEKTLKKTGGNVAKAARILGVTPPTLHYKIKKNNYDLHDWE